MTPLNSVLGKGGLMRGSNRGCLLALVILTGCVTDQDSPPPPWHGIDMSFEPVGRIVSTDRDYGYQLYSYESDAGTQYVYNDEIRSPDSPVGALPVDCDETKQIGVWLLPKPPKKKSRGLYREVEIYAKEPKVDVQWSHSERPDGDTRYHWKSGVDFAYRFITRINLAKEDRVDGVMTLNIWKADELLYSTSFQLMGCGLRKQ